MTIRSIAFTVLYVFGENSFSSIFTALNNATHTVLRTLFWGLTLMTVFAVQVLPNSFLQCDIECAEVVDLEESESEESEKKESEKKRSFDEGKTLSGIQSLNSLSCFHFLNEFPIPPYSETLSPPPDLN